MFRSENRNPHQTTVPPDDFVRFVARLLWESLWPLFGLHLSVAALVILAASIGIVLGLGPFLLLTALTLYPSWLALLAAAAGQLMGQHGTAWRAAGWGLRRFGLESAFLGLLLNAYLYSYLTSSAWVATGASDGLLWSVWGAQSFFLVVVAATLVYALPLMALHGQPIRIAVRNGLLLAVRSPGATVAMLAGLALGGLAFYWLGLGAALFAPFVLNILLVSNCQMQIECHLARQA